MRTRGVTCIASIGVLRSACKPCSSSRRYRRVFGAVRESSRSNPARPPSDGKCEAGELEAEPCVEVVDHAAYRPQLRRPAANSLASCRRPPSPCHHPVVLSDVLRLLSRVEAPAGALRRRRRFLFESEPVALSSSSLSDFPSVWTAGARVTGRTRVWRPHVSLIARLFLSSVKLHASFGR